MSIHLGSLTVTAAAAADSPTTTPIPEEEEFYSSWSLFLVCLLLILSLWTSYYLQIKRIRAVHETVVSIVAGMVVGFIVRLAPGHLIREMLTFKHTLFFNLLLPPIILASGYELKQESFFRNFGSILTFAFLGTFISAVGVGVLVYIWSLLDIESLDLSLLECLIFGTTLSATDPVTILAIFNQYKVDPKLYTIIFGESLLNDAVSIVMYDHTSRLYHFERTLSQFHGTEIYLSSLFHGIGIFLLAFSVSMALGVAFGLAMSLVLKHSSLAMYPSIESCLVALCAYTCYFFSNGLSMSGIVSLLFCGITLKHYAYHTMSRRTQRATKYIFGTLSQLSENFIFIYLGLSLFTSPPAGAKVTSYVKPLFITVTTVAVIFTRYAAVFPLSELINFFQRHARGQRSEEIPHAYQMMLFWAGLRGAVGVALAAGFQGENAQTLRTTVLVVVVLTVVMFGGTTARMLEVLGIRTGIEDDAASSDDDEPLPIRRGGGNVRWQRLPDDPHHLNMYRSQSPQSYNHHVLSQSRSRSRSGSPLALDNNQLATAGHRSSSSIGNLGRSHGRQISSPVRTGSLFSAASSDEYDSDSGEVLPLVSTAGASTGAGVGAGPTDAPVPSPLSPLAAERIEDGRWFQAIDERYLLPLFSNATASRSFYARRMRRASGVGEGSGASSGAEVEPGEEAEEDEPEVDLGRRASSAGVAQVLGLGLESRVERGLPSPTLRRESDPALSQSP
ncbi:Sodium/hydrogen exchanger family-domain-containing protein [Lactarius quietus]|nr:Sodium/hydrogen exchanger family-domain-containing protein [Lactarius quietus]